MLTTIRVWALDRNVLLNESDVDYCKNNGIQIDSQASEHQRIETGPGRVYHYRTSNGFVKLTTFGDKSETMLQLRYAGHVTLFHIAVT